MVARIGERSDFDSAAEQSDNQAVISYSEGTDGQLILFANLGTHVEKRQETDSGAIALDEAVVVVEVSE